MSAEATGWVFARSPYSGAFFAVHLAIADSVNDQNDNELWMSVSRLAGKARVGRDRCREALRQMADDGLIELLEERPGGTTRYRLLLPPDAEVLWTTRPRVAPEARGGVVEGRASGAGGSRLRRGDPAAEARGGRAWGATNPRRTQAEPNPNPPQPVDNSDVEADQVGGRVDQAIARIVDREMDGVALLDVRHPASYRTAITERIRATWLSRLSAAALDHPDADAATLVSIAANPRRLPPKRGDCLDCAGTGRAVDDDATLILCSACDGTGHAHPAETAQESPAGVLVG